jgi:hypothetical protein
MIGRNPLADPSARMVLAWVGLYTRGLSASVAADRRAELSADLWDEAVVAAATGPPQPVARQRLSRLIRGMPADLIWRLDHRAGRTSEREIVMRPSILEWVLLLVAGAMCAYAAVGGVLMLLDPSVGDWDGWGRYGFGGGGLVGLIGLIVSVARPTLGLMLVAAGMILLAVAAPWLWPFAAFVTVAAFVRWAINREHQVSSQSA